MVRFKNRYIYAEYILFPFENENDNNTLFHYTCSGLASALRQSIQNNFGLATLARVSQSLSVKYFNHNLRCALIRCSRDSLPLVWMSLSSVPGGCKDDQGRLGKWIWRGLSASGSIKGCKKKTLIIIRKNISRLTTLSKNNNESSEEIKKCLELIKKSIQEMEP